MGLFGKKIVCFECSKKVKEKASVYRRHMRFCSQTCLQNHVTANPVRPAPGTDAGAHTREAKIRLDSAFGALAVAARGRGVGGTGAVDAALGMQAREETLAALHQFDQFVLEALPYLYAIGKGNLAEQLEVIDLEPLHGATAGPAQIAKALEPVLARVQSIANQL